MLSTRAVSPSLSPSIFSPASWAQPVSGSFTSRQDWAGLWQVNRSPWCGSFSRSQVSRMGLSELKVKVGDESQTFLTWNIRVNFPARGCSTVFTMESKVNTQGQSLMGSVALVLANPFSGCLALSRSRVVHGHTAAQWKCCSQHFLPRLRACRRS